MSNQKPSLNSAFNPKVLPRLQTAWTHRSDSSCDCFSRQPAAFLSMQAGEMSELTRPPTNGWRRLAYLCGWSVGGVDVQRRMPHHCCSETHTPHPLLLFLLRCSHTHPCVFCGGAGVLQRRMTLFGTSGTQKKGDATLRRQQHNKRLEPNTHRADPNPNPTHRRVEISQISPQPQTQHHLGGLFLLCRSMYHPSSYTHTPYRSQYCYMGAKGSKPAAHIEVMGGDLQGEVSVRDGFDELFLDTYRPRRGGGDAIFFPTHAPKQPLCWTG